MFGKAFFETMEFLGMVEPNMMCTLILQWELETFWLFAVISREYQYQVISKKSEQNSTKLLMLLRINN